jgi:ribosomal protein L7/L12
MPEFRAARGMPTAAALALQEGRWLEAIKQVRDAEGLDLAAAKARVEAYVAADPALQERLRQLKVERGKKLRVWIVAIDAVLIAAGAYWLFGR